LRREKKEGEREKRKKTTRADARAAEIVALAAESEADGEEKKIFSLV